MLQTLTDLFNSDAHHLPFARNLTDQKEFQIIFQLRGDVMLNLIELTKRATVYTLNTADIDQALTCDFSDVNQNL